MEVFKYDMKLVETCAKCRKQMFPLLYADGRCCDLFMMEHGKTNYKCPSCGGEKDVPHRHGKRL
jgi:predicted RNA-binding Zn-ribbon protein involved in translation (DUF1610 family)